MKQPRIVIIGAGPCGLGAAWRLTELGCTNFQLYEKQAYPGGLATSFTDTRGFTWDIGGHVVHSHYPYVDEMFETVMKGEYLTHKRASFIWTGGRFIPYPLQQHLQYLPKPLEKACLDGLRGAAKRKTVPKHFVQWLERSFGDALCRQFFLPYNRKVWAYPLNRMSYQWVGERVAPAEKKQSFWGLNAVFRFPKRGGTGELWRRVAKRFSDHVTYGKELVRINTAARRVVFSDGTWAEYDFLLSSIPLDRLVGLMDVPLPDPQKSLHASAIAIVGLGFSGETPEDLQKTSWIYFPDPGIPFFRATVLSNYSPYNSPNGTWSLMTEIASSHFRPLPKGDLIKHVLRGAVKAKLIKKSAQVIDTWVYQTAYGYPTPTLNRDTYLEKVFPLLEHYHISSRGRFGAWTYEVSNQDHTFMQGVEWVNRVLLGENEHIAKS